MCDKAALRAIAVHPGLRCKWSWSSDYYTLLRTRPWAICVLRLRDHCEGDLDCRCFEPPWDGKHLT